jgi:N-acetylmuramoyl-L-alanine amidase
VTRALLAPLIVAALAAPAAAQKIVIDAGHGGTDPGGVGNSLQEKNIVLDVALRFRDLLVADTADTAGGGAWTVHLTRDDDTFVGLSARADYANSLGADRFLSIHSNAFSDPSANGTETFSYTDTGDGAALRNLVQEEMIAAWGLRDRGNKVANFAVLRETAMPAILHELAFITNAGEAAVLGNPEKRQDAAEAHLRGLQRHYGIAPYVPGGGTPMPATGGVEGIVSGPEGPLAGVTVSLNAGGAATTAEDGTFRIDAVPVGEHVVSAVAPGYRAASATITVASGQVAPVDLFLELVEDPADPEEPGESGGCSTTGGASPLASLLALALWRRRRRR